MHSTSLRRLPLLALAALAMLLVVPVAARADDQSFARTALTQATTLKRAEESTQKALRRVDSRGRSAIPAARQQIKLVRRQVRVMIRVVRGERTSTPDGATLKAKLIELLAVEQRAYGTLDTALAAYRRGDVRTANTLLSRAKRQLRGVADAAVRVGRQLRAMGA